MSQAIPRKNVVKNIDSDFMPSKIMNADDVAFFFIPSHNSKFLTNLNFPPKQKSPFSKTISYFD